MAVLRPHLALTVSDVERSIPFYRALFGAEPVKEKPGYAKFLPEWGPVNLALSQGGGPGTGPVNHLGLQLETTAEVMSQLDRVKAAGLPVREEMAVDCCHANQDKFWVVDPDGAEWEVYHLNYDLEDELPTTTQPVSLGLPMAKAAGGCCSR